MADHEDDIIDLTEAAEILGVQPEQVEAMADEGMLTPVLSGGGMRFHRAEALAVREAGA